MRFGADLTYSVYEPWAKSYIDYPKLKKLLREDEVDKKNSPWTDDDESRFVEELLNTQLEKVNAFQHKTYQNLRERTTDCERQLQVLKTNENDPPPSESEDKTSIAKDVISDLDKITSEINELQKFSRVNYTGFLKAAKKHDRRRGAKYKVRPLLQVRLAALPFNSEDYAPLLYEISSMYSFARGQLQGDILSPGARSESKSGGERYTSYKFWVHQDNLIEVKTYVLRRLPILVFNRQTSKVAEGASDPSFTCLYFDNEKFSLYRNKLTNDASASSLRLRWFGPLADKPEVVFEKKIVEHDIESEVKRMAIKEKNIEPFISGTYHMDKELEKVRQKEGTDTGGSVSLKQIVPDIQSFIQENELQPVLRANYNRTAFQIPGDDKIRISIDTDLAFIREDALSDDRPCRDPQDWHRGDIDRLGLKYPFDEIRQGEVSRFPHAVLEIKVAKGASKRSTHWVRELMSSHLLKEAPKFSKFVHGVASLFEDHVNSFPFWLSDLETDIRKSPEDAFREEQEKKASKAADELAVGSFIGSRSKSSFKNNASPAAKSHLEARRKLSTAEVKHIASEEAVSNDEVEQTKGSGGVLASVLSFSPFSNTKYARAHRNQPVELPPGVQKPSYWIKDMNDVKVEPKVWLANERTFFKWQHISILLASLSLGLYNAAGKVNNVARIIAVVYTIIAIFASAWGWWMYIKRARMIEARSGKDFDNVVGPIIVCIGLIIALILNFGLKYHSDLSESDSPASAVVSQTEL